MSRGWLVWLALFSSLTFAKNYYEVLRITNNASHEQIVDAVAREWALARGDEGRQKEIAEASQVLANEASRAKYDLKSRENIARAAPKPAPSYYEILGINPNVTMEVIENRIRNERRHLELLGNSAALDELEQMEKTLTVASSRKAYNQSLLVAERQRSVRDIEEASSVEALVEAALRYVPPEALDQKQRGIAARDAKYLIKGKMRQFAKAAKDPISQARVLTAFHTLRQKRPDLAIIEVLGYFPSREIAKALELAYSATPREGKERPANQIELLEVAIAGAIKHQLDHKSGESEERSKALAEMTALIQENRGQLSLPAQDPYLRAMASFLEKGSSAYPKLVSDELDRQIAHIRSESRLAWLDWVNGNPKQMAIGLGISALGMYGALGGFGHVPNLEAGRNLILAYTSAFGLGGIYGLIRAAGSYIEIAKPRKVAHAAKAKINDLERLQSQLGVPASETERPQAKLLSRFCNGLRKLVGP